MGSGGRDGQWAAVGEAGEGSRGSCHADWDWEGWQAGTPQHGHGHGHGRTLGLGLSLGAAPLPLPLPLPAPALRVSDRAQEHAHDRFRAPLPLPLLPPAQAHAHASIDRPPAALPLPSSTPSSSSPFSHPSLHPSHRRPLSPPRAPLPHRAPSPISMPIYTSFNRMSPIHSLPVELLTTIFQLGVDSDPIPDDQIRGEPTFEVLVSHVCRHWRQVALHTPHLWTTIHFRTRAHMSRGEAYLSRNSHLPIDIYVDTCSDDDYQLRKDLLFRDQFLPVFQVVLPHINRWRELHLIVADLECKASARKVLSTCGSAPKLRTLQLWHVQNWQTSERLYNQIGPPPVVVFGGELPELKHIILQGVNLPWSRSPFLRNLTSIEFALHSDNVRMPFNLWREMLQASPHLTRLSLLFAGPRAAPSGSSTHRDGIEWWGAEPPMPDAVLAPGEPLPPSTDPVQLLELKEVQLNNLECDYLIALFRTLDAPNVRSLHLGLDFEDQDFTPFVEYLAAPPHYPSVKAHHHRSSSSTPGTDAQASRAKFPALERLSVSALRCSLPSWRALLASARGVTRLEADFAQLADGAFDVLLEPSSAPADAPSQPQAGPSSSSSTPAEPLLPLLSSVRVSGVPCKQLADLASIRRASGRRVRRWEIDEAGRDEDGDAFERETASLSAAWRKEQEAAIEAGQGKREPWRLDEPLERVVWFREEEDDDDEDDEEGAESDFGEGEGEEYAEDDGEHGDG